MNNVMKCFKAQPAAVLQLKNKFKTLNYCEWMKVRQIDGVRMR